MVVLRRDQSSARLRQVLHWGLDNLHLILVSWSLLLLAGLLFLLLPMLMLRARIPLEVLC